MTRFTEEQYRCSKCGKIHSFRCYSEISNTQNPELHEDVLKGRIFEETCPDCGASNYIVYPLLYQDEERKLLLFLSNTDSRANPLQPLLSFLKEQQDESSKKLLESLEKEYTVRIVKTPNQLSEKMQIFEHHLDDRILEMMKVLMRGEIARAKPDLKITGLYYTPSAARRNDIFSIETEEGFGQAVDLYPDLYDGLKKEVLPKLSDKQKNAVVIDEDWAFEAMGYKKKDEKKDPSKMS